MCKAEKNPTYHLLFGSDEVHHGGRRVFIHILPLMQSWQQDSCRVTHQGLGVRIGSGKSQKRGDEAENHP